jgi:hypothetical protein
VAGGLEQKINVWKAQGLNVAWVTLLVDNPDNSKPPTDVGAKQWRDQHGLDSVYVAADPTTSMVPSGTTSFGTPMFNVVDPRTMEVVKHQMGSGGTVESKIEEIAKKNAGL